MLAILLEPVNLRTLVGPGIDLDGIRDRLASHCTGETQRELWKSVKKNCSYFEEDKFKRLEKNLKELGIELASSRGGKEKGKRIRKEK